MPSRIAIFDVLGTVLDERSGFLAAATAALAEPLGAPALAERWLAAVDAEVAQIASASASWRPWEWVIADALATVTAGDIGGQGGPRGGGLVGDEPQLRSVGRRLPPWPDSSEGIAALRGHLPVVALSNAGVGALLECSRAADITWDAVFSAEMVRSAKPDPRVYRFALDQLGVDAREVVMVAAHPWDLRAAAAHGMSTAYVKRPGEAGLKPGDDFDWVVDDLVELAAALRD